MEVTVHFYKTTGKYYITEKYFSKLNPWDGPKVTAEVKEKYPLTNRYHYVIEVDNGSRWNSWLNINK